MPIEGTESDGGYIQVREGVSRMQMKGLGIWARTQGACVSIVNVTDSSLTWSRAAEHAVERYLDY